MPYSDSKKKKEHYVNYKKAYNVKWIDENRDYWNNYQNKYKVKKRFEVVKNIILYTRELNISDEGSKAFNATIVFFYMNETGITKPSAISYRTGFDLLEVKSIINNWIKSGLFCKKEKVFFLDKNENYLEEIIQLSLVCLVGSGELVCVHN